MDVLSTVLNVAKPTGVWPSIINAFESGVGSYLLAVVLITILIRIILSPFDVFNRRITKKQTSVQAKLQPEIEKIQKKYGNDKALVNQKTQELYRKSGMSLGGSCLFMLVFMTINLLVFFSLFSSLNRVADYKINQEYLTLKDSYTNVLNIVDAYGKDGSFVSYTNLLGDYENLSISVVEEDGKTYIVAKDQNDSLVYKTEKYETFEKYEKTDKTLEAGNITDQLEGYNEENEFTKVKVLEDQKEIIYYVLTEKIAKAEDETYSLTENVDLYKFLSSDEGIVEIIRTIIEKENVDDGEESSYTFIGDEIVSGETTLSQAVQKLALDNVYDSYEQIRKGNSFLWIGSIWVADAPFKNSVLTFDQYKGEIGAANVSEYEEVIYNSFMTPLRETRGKANGYFILAIISMGVSYLASWLSQLTTQKEAKAVKKGKLSKFILPAIMGVFAIFYNSVFAIYLVVSQAIAAAIAPLSNLIIKKWEEHDKKKEEAKSPVVDYRRK